MAININVGSLGADEAKTTRALWNLTNKVVISRTTTLPGSPTDGDIYIVPAGAVSHSEEIAFRSEGAWLYLVPEKGWMAYVADSGSLVIHDGADWNAFTGGGGGGGGITELSLFAGGKPTTGELLFRHEFTTAIGIPIDLTGSQGSSGVAATASAVLSLKKNGTQFGTATWAVAGTEPTFAAAAIASFAVGDVLSITAPVTPDATLADISLSIVGLPAA
jgi:hypothetical protein